MLFVAAACGPFPSGESISMQGIECEEWTFCQSYELKNSNVMQKKNNTRKKNDTDLDLAR